MRLANLLEVFEHKPFQLRSIEYELELFGYNLLHRDINAAQARLEEINRLYKELAERAKLNSVESAALLALGTSLFFAPEIKDYFRTNIELPGYAAAALRAAGGIGFLYGLLKILGNMNYHREGQNHLNEAQHRLEQTLRSPSSSTKLQ